MPARRSKQSLELQVAKNAADIAELKEVQSKIMEDIHGLRISVSNSATKDDIANLRISFAEGLTKVLPEAINALPQRVLAWGALGTIFATLIAGAGALIPLLIHVLSTR